MSENGGNSWEPLTEDFEHLAIGSMAFDPSQAMSFIWELEILKSVVILVLVGAFTSLWMRVKRHTSVDGHAHCQSD